MVSPALFLVVNTTLKGLSSPGLVYFCHSQFVPTHLKTLGFLTGTLCLCSSFSFPLSFPPVGLGERHIRTRYISSFLLKETRSFYSEAKNKISDIKSSTMPKRKGGILRAGDFSSEVQLELDLNSHRNGMNRTSEGKVSLSSPPDLRL